MSCDECNVISLYVLCCSDKGSGCFLCFMFDREMFGKTIRNMFGYGCYFVVECLVWVEVLCWINRVWSSKERACCACDHSVHLSVQSIGFVYV